MAQKKVAVDSENNDFQHADVLKRNRVKRQKNREFFVEGVKPIEQAIANHWEISAILYDKNRPLSDWAKRILQQSNAKIHFELRPELMQKLSDKAETSELIALVRMAKDDLARIPISKDFLVIILDRPASPGNLGTIIRTCNAFTVNGIIITGHSVDLYDPKTVRASIGTLFSTPVIRIGSPSELLPWFEKVRTHIGELQIVGSSAKGTKSISDQDFTKATILIIGNETWGLSAQYKELSNALIRIPMHGAASSLNVASAASILLDEIQKQRDTGE